VTIGIQAERGSEFVDSAYRENKKDANYFKKNLEPEEKNDGTASRRR